jgi:hypothetical protein
VKDSEPHDLEVSVHLNGAVAKIAGTLDGRALYEWSGPIAHLGRGSPWSSTPAEYLALGTASPDWSVSEIKAKRLSTLFGSNPQSPTSTPPPLKHLAANRAAVAKDADGWENVLAQLTDAEVEENGQDWRLVNGELLSPLHPSMLVLPGEYAGASYQVRAKLQQLYERESISFLLPVGDHMVGAALDGWPTKGWHSGLNLVDGQDPTRLAGSVDGKQIKDAGRHNFEVTVRLNGANATITARLDAKPFFEWTGAVSSLSLSKYWITAPPGSLCLATHHTNWSVSELKVKRLDGR